jgi:hypothetical protein
MRNRVLENVINPDKNPKKHFIHTPANELILTLPTILIKFR